MPSLRAISRVGNTLAFPLQNFFLILIYFVYFLGIAKPLV